MLMPKRVKYRKQMRGRMRGKALRGAEVSFGDFGLQALEPGWVSARQIEAARRALVRVMKRRGKVWIRIFPDKPYTQKPPETRMGKGKGNVEYWVAVVKPGRVMFELAGLDNETAIEALHQASYKFSIRTKVVSRHEVQAQHAKAEEPEGEGEQA
jgi:large subunit ribosomal protein L16